MMSRSSLRAYVCTATCPGDCEQQLCCTAGTIFARTTRVMPAFLAAAGCCRVQKHCYCIRGGRLETLLGALQSVQSNGGHL